MTNENFRKDYAFFNKTIFTEQNIPLPCSDDEKIHFFNENAKFFTEIGTGQLHNTLKYQSSSGKLFLTSHRIIFRPEGGDEYFSSFHCALSLVVNVYDDHFQFNFEDLYLAKVFISFEDTYKQLFYGLLRDLSAGGGVKENEGENFNDLPYYCDIQDNNF